MMISGRLADAPGRSLPVNKGRKRLCLLCEEGGYPQHFVNIRGEAGRGGVDRGLGDLFGMEIRRRTSQRGWHLGHHLAEGLHLALPDHFSVCIKASTLFFLKSHVASVARLP